MPSLADIIAWLNRLWNLLQRLDSLLQGIDNNTYQAVTYLREPNRGWVPVSAAILDPLYGISAAVHAIDDARSAIMTALGNLPLNPVTLPGTPPAGYGGADAEAVWTYMWDGVRQQGEIVRLPYDVAIHERYQHTTKVPIAPWFYAYYPVVYLD